MKVTRLQLLLLFIALGVGGYFGYAWWQNRSTTTRPTPEMDTPPTTQPSSESRLPPKSESSSTDSTSAVAQQPSIPSTIDSSYVVMKGDTLWRIAQVQSPVHQGPGWAAIWLANKRTIKDFDHLEVGSALRIPSTPEEYVMPYWKPRDSASASRPATTTLVDLHQLPAGGESVIVDLRQLPLETSVLVDLRQLPDPRATMLAQRPTNFNVDLNELPTSSECVVVLASLPETFSTSALRPPVETYFGQPSYH